MPDGDFIDKKLIAQDSIHTIKEGDQSMEDDDTLHEESRQEIILRNQHNPSPVSPGHRVPLSQLDVAFSKVRSPSLRWPHHQLNQ